MEIVIFCISIQKGATNIPQTTDQFLLPAALYQNYLEKIISSHIIKHIEHAI